MSKGKTRIYYDDSKYDFALEIDGQDVTTGLRVISVHLEAGCLPVAHLRVLPHEVEIEDPQLRCRTPELRRLANDNGYVLVKRSEA